MTPIKRVAIFLMMLGMEKGQKVISLMDNGEIKAVVAEIQKLKVISSADQQRVWVEFQDLGYDEMMNSVEVLTVIRFLFDGSKINVRE